ncbi:hypothetical protein [Liberiplasma polymorphum]|uniref:hypothetical protein n=1 Tax=Liberiplasma polymorphum TaxID=3374570 RepID=UPI0037725E4B
MKKVFILLLIFVLSSVLYGCPPEEEPDYLSNKDLLNYVHIDLYQYYEDDESIIVFLVDQPNLYFSNIYFSSTSFEILNASAFGRSLTEEIIDGVLYYGVDFTEINLEDNPSFYLFLSVTKSSLFESLAYDDYFKSNIALNQMELIFNYDISLETQDKHDYIFYVHENLGSYMHETYRFDVYNNVDSLLENTNINTVYLPFLNQEIVALKPEILYYPYYDTIFINGYNFSVRIEESDTPFSYNVEEKTIHTFNGIAFTLVKERHNIYSITFFVTEDDTTFKYHYYGVSISASEIIHFIESIHPYTVED